MNKPTRFALTRRDIRLFDYLFSTRGALMSQIRRDVFGDVSNQAVSRRVKKLLDRGYLKRDCLFTNRPMGYYYLSKKVVKSRLLYDFELSNTTVKSSNREHEACLVDVRYKFQQLSGFEAYLTENELQNGLCRGIDYPFEDFRRLNCDGFMSVFVNGTLFNGAVEYEHYWKSKARYLRLFKDFYLSPRINFVFYVTANKSLGKRMQREDKKARGEKGSKIFMVPFDELMNATDSVVLESSSASTLNLPFVQKDKS